MYVIIHEMGRALEADPKVLQERSREQEGRACTL